MIRNPEGQTIGLRSRTIGANDLNEDVAFFRQITCGLIELHSEIKARSLLVCTNDELFAKVFFSGKKLWYPQKIFGLVKSFAYLVDSGFGKESRGKAQYRYENQDRFQPLHRDKRHGLLILGCFL